MRSDTIGGRPPVDTKCFGHSGATGVDGRSSLDSFWLFVRVDLLKHGYFLELFARKGVFYIISNSTLPAQLARPLHVLPQAVAYTLDPDPFFYWHILQATTLAMKAGCAAVIGIYLVGNRAVSRLPRPADSATILRSRCN